MHYFLHLVQHPDINPSYTRPNNNREPKLRPFAFSSPIKRAKEGKITSYWVSDWIQFVNLAAADQCKRNCGDNVLSWMRSSAIKFKWTTIDRSQIGRQVYLYLSLYILFPPSSTACSRDSCLPIYGLIWVTDSDCLPHWMRGLRNEWTQCGNYTNAS